MLDYVSFIHFEENVGQRTQCMIFSRRLPRVAVEFCHIAISIDHRSTFGECH